MEEQNMTDHCTDHADRDQRPGGILDLLLSSTKTQKMKVASWTIFCSIRCIRNCGLSTPS